jgi:hypothetical protein
VITDSLNLSSSELIAEVILAEGVELNEAEEIARRLEADLLINKQFKP